MRNGLERNARLAKFARWPEFFSDQNSILGPSPGSPERAWGAALAERIPPEGPLRLDTEGSVERNGGKCRDRLLVLV